MTVEFRCEKCGKLLNVDAQPGSTTRCPHCNKKLRVPEGLAALPRPHVPPSAGAGGAGGDPQLEEEGEPERNDAVMAAMAQLMPWVMSVFFHLGLAVIMMFFVIYSQGRLPDNVIVPNLAGADEEDPGALDPGELDPTKESTQAMENVEKRYSARESALPADTGRTDQRAQLLGIGEGESAGSGDAFGLDSGGGGSVPFYGRGGRGNVHHVVFVVDRSGSMAQQGRFTDVRLNMVLTISELKRTQDFEIVLFAENKAMTFAGQLVAATKANKTAAVTFLESDEVHPHGKTTVLPALRHAFKVLGRADRRKKGKLVFLLTDGEFAGIGGGSRYEGLSGNEAVIKWLQDSNTEGEVQVNTYLYASGGGGGGKGRAADVMKQIAKDNGGYYKAIGVDE